MIIQGSEYPLEFEIQTENGETLDNSLVDEIEFCVGDLRKLYKRNKEDSEVKYDQENRVYLFPLLEQETYDMTETIMYQFRVKFTSGKIYPSQPVAIGIVKSMTASKPFEE